MVSLKTIGQNGQISLGKEYAGQNILVEEIEPGYWTIKTGEFIPHDELWLHERKISASLDRALSWAKKHPPKDSHPDKLLRN